MNTHSEKTKENQHRAAANDISKNRDDDQVLSQFTDNRPEAIAQRRLQEAADNNSRKNRLDTFRKNREVAQLPATVDHSSDGLQNLSPLPLPARSITGQPNDTCERAADRTVAQAVRQNGQAVTQNPARTKVGSFPHRYANASTGVNSLSIQRYPQKKDPENSKDPMYFESKHPEIELIRLELDVYRIKGTEQSVRWFAQSRKYKMKRPGPVPEWVDFDMEKFAADPQFLDFMTMFKEVSKATQNETDENLKRALQMHVLQRFMANALYSAEEISKMHYQASPLNFQDGGSYIRSEATAFVDALKKFITAGNVKAENLHLVRNTDFNEIMGQFLERFDGTDLKTDLSAKTEQIATFLMDRGKLEGFGDAYGMLFADVTKNLQDSDLTILQETVDSAAEAINKKVFADSLTVVIAKYVEKNYNDATTKEEIKAELFAHFSTGSKDLKNFLAYINPKLSSRFETQKQSEIEKISQDILKTQGADDAETLFPNFNKEIGGYVDWLKTQKKSRELTTQETALVDKRGDKRPEFKALLKTDSFRGYLEAKKGPIRDRTYTDLTAETVDVGALSEMKALHDNLKTGLPDIVMVGGSVKLGNQPGFLLKSDTAAQLVHMVEFGLNKAGYVPTPTASSRKMLEMGKSLKEIVMEVAKQQRENAKEAGTRLKIQQVIDEVDGFDPDSYKSKIETVDQLKKTKKTFDEFQKLVNDAKDYVKLQATAVMKLIKGLAVLEEGSGFPAIALEELQVNLADALTNKDDIAAFIRNIQNIHETLILELERNPEKTTGTQIKAPEGAMQPHYTDYGLKAFAQAYNAVLAQHGDKDTLVIDAYSNIYFELVQKLNQVNVTSGTKVDLRNPENINEYYTRDLFVEMPSPNLVMIDIHPNDAAKLKMDKQEVVELILAMFDKKPEDYRLTVIVDITLNHVTDPEVGTVKTAVQKYLSSGQLNLVFIQSLTKFAQLGTDKQSGGMMFHFNDGSETWRKFNESVATSTSKDVVDPTVKNYFNALFKYTETEQVRYLEKVRENTRYVYQKLTEEFAKLGKDPKTIELSLSNDPATCYVAFNYKELGDRLFIGSKDRDHETEMLGKRIANEAIYELVNKLKLPLSMRQSFGFPISNLGEAWVGLRFTIGTETKEMLDDYIRIITYVKAKLAAVPDEDMKNDQKRKQKFKEFSSDIDTVNDLREKLDEQFRQRV